mmetsp:Transcript_29041/g.54344  ORF Transcript_29041/g.54344 Transcript_29041/m.54344 type:complete len:131 (-) Transcript_29041:495-887(-)
MEAARRGFEAMVYKMETRENGSHRSLLCRHTRANVGPKMSMLTGEGAKTTEEGAADLSSSISASGAKLFSAPVSARIGMRRVVPEIRPKITGQRVVETLRVRSELLGLMSSSSGLCWICPSIFHFFKVFI